MAKITEQITATRELDYVPCLNCGSTDVKFFDLGYTQGNSGGGKCNKCGKEHTSRMHWDAKLEQWVAAWNAHNDPEKLIQAQREIIQSAEDRIQEILAKKAAIATPVTA